MLRSASVNGQPTDAFTALLGHELAVDPASVHSEWKFNDILTLNVGGKSLVQTLRSTMTVVRGSVLAALFGGHWDTSLIRDNNGNIFVDQDPDIFLPLLNYLRVMNMSTYQTSSPLLPVTPTFGDEFKETAFRSMVDDWLLTNVLYNYEVHRYEQGRFVMVTQNIPIYDFVMTCTDQCGMSQPRCVSYCLDRPRRQNGGCHKRKVHSFAVACETNVYSPIAGVRVVVGWTLRHEHLYAQESQSFDTIQSIAFDTKNHTLKWIKTRGKWVQGQKQLVRDSSKILHISCSRSGGFGSNNLEWYIDGDLVASTFSSVTPGTWSTSHVHPLLGVTSQNKLASEWIPYIKVYPGGVCRLTMLELEE